MEQKSNTFLETEKIGKLMRKYSIPCIISLLVRALYNIVDQIFIANASYLQALGKAVESTLISLPRDVVICPTINANLGLTCLNKSAIFKLFKQVWVCESADQGIIRRRNKRKGTLHEKDGIADPGGKPGRPEDSGALWSGCGLSGRRSFWPESKSQKFYKRRNQRGDIFCP